VFLKWRFKPECALYMTCTSCAVCVHFSPPMRQFLMDGDFFVGAALATSLTKLALKFVKLTPDTRKQNVSSGPGTCALLIYKEIFESNYLKSPEAETILKEN